MMASRQYRQAAGVGSAAAVLRQHDAMGVVSALRETSVVYAAIIGRFFLKEKLSARRITSCLAIAMGAACLAY
jgi:drug/metabolite transporter (DMT)-like permease